MVLLLHSNSWEDDEWEGSYWGRNSLDRLCCKNQLWTDCQQTEGTVRCTSECVRCQNGVVAGHHLKLVTVSRVAGSNVHSVQSHRRTVSHWCWTRFSLWFAVREVSHMNSVDSGSFDTLVNSLNLKNVKLNGVCDQNLHKKVPFSKPSSQALNSEWLLQLSKHRRWLEKYILSSPCATSAPEPICQLNCRWTLTSTVWTGAVVAVLADSVFMRSSERFVHNTRKNVTVVSAIEDSVVAESDLLIARRRRACSRRGMIKYCKSALSFM